MFEVAEQELRYQIIAKMVWFVVIILPNKERFFDP